MYVFENGRVAVERSSKEKAKEESLQVVVQPKKKAKKDLKASASDVDKPQLPQTLLGIAHLDVVAASYEHCKITSRAIEGEPVGHATCHQG